MSQKNTLWTKDFTIISIGSLISMAGNQITAFSIGLLVLDYTESKFLYAIYLLVFTLPQLIMPVISGAILDRFSRKKTIYTLDFISAGIFALTALIMAFGTFSFPIFAVLCFCIGSIQGIYTVAFESFYPLLITEGNYSKAYSIASIMETLAMVMVPVATFFYKNFGIVPVFAANSILFLTAAIFETQIKAKEDYLEESKKTRTEGISKVKQTLIDIKEGIQYLNKEKGLLSITAYFTVLFVAYGILNTLVLPFFRSNFENGEYIYLIVSGVSMAFRGVGSFIHYKFKLPVDKKYSIALIVYLITAIIQASFLYTSLPIMILLYAVEGVLGVTSFTIRIAATQSYVPNDKKGRFNGAFHMLTTMGSLLGQFLAGVLSFGFNEKTIITIAYLACFVLALVLIGGNKKEVSKIYNREQ